MNLSLHAQKNNLEIGLFVGASVMGGDLVRSNLGSVSDANLAYGLILHKYVNANLAVRLNALNTRLVSSDLKPSQSEDGQIFSSETSLTELSVLVEYDILGHRRNFQATAGGLSPYIFLGAGAALTDPKPTFGEDSEEVTLDKEANYSKTRFILPFGAGLRYNVSDKMALGFELGVRPAFSDYLDGISQSRNPDKNDWYGFGSFQFWYNLSKNAVK
ncbi:MAG: outer membrane beta-barrel protein [Lewinella sp.]|nr:outer membrane beta-barrel protein [Lewinella sp.]